MTDNNNGRNGGPTGGSIGLMLGGVAAVAALFFILAGGPGVKEVNSDADLPAVASPEKTK
jgi:hypothetical protein